MTVIPNFILKRMYRTGSLRVLEGGLAFDIVNTLGPGQISRINRVILNCVDYEPEVIWLLMNEEKIHATAITEESPATFFLNQVVTCMVAGAKAEAGSYDMTLDLVSREAGHVKLSVTDRLSV